MNSTLFTSFIVFEAPSALSASFFEGALNPRLIGMRTCCENCYPGFLGFVSLTKGNNLKLHFYVDIENQNKKQPCMR